MHPSQYYSVSKCWSVPTVRSGLCPLVVMITCLLLELGQCCHRLTECGCKHSRRVSSIQASFTYHITRGESTVQSSCSCGMVPSIPLCTSTLHTLHICDSIIIIYTVVVLHPPRLCSLFPLLHLTPAVKPVSLVCPVCSMIIYILLN